MGLWVPVWERVPHRDRSHVVSSLARLKMSGWMVTTLHTASAHATHEVLVHHLTRPRQERCHCWCALQCSSWEHSRWHTAGRGEPVCEYCGGNLTCYIKETERNTETSGQRLSTPHTKIILQKGLAWQILHQKHVPYLPLSGELTVHEGLLLYGCRIVIPTSFRADILRKLHEGHLGITKCRERAKQSVWWPGLSMIWLHLTWLIKNCDICRCERTNFWEKLQPTDFPARPWSTVRADLFQTESNKHYLVVVDSFSRFFEVAKLTQTTSEVVIEHFKSIFARHGIPDVVRWDNRPQFASEHFRKFAQEWGFSHVMPSSHFPQSNRDAERAVRTIKGLLKKSSDPYLALMAYRAAPLANGHSPAEFLMGRKIRTLVPAIPSHFNPGWTDMDSLKRTEQKHK